MPHIFFLRRLAHGATMVCAFFVENVAASFVSVLAPIAKSGLNRRPFARERDPQMNDVPAFERFRSLIRPFGPPSPERRRVRG
jgi:hypothetical protein